MLNIYQASQVATSSRGLKTSTTVAALNLNRNAIIIQNQDTNPLYIAFGVTASSSVYDIVLPSCTVAADGTGGVFLDGEGTVFTGLITCYSGGTPSYTVLEIGS